MGPFKSRMLRVSRALALVSPPLLPPSFSRKIKEDNRPPTNIHLPSFSPPRHPRFPTLCCNKEKNVQERQKVINFRFLHLKKENTAWTFIKLGKSTVPISKAWLGDFFFFPLLCCYQHKIPYNHSILPQAPPTPVDLTYVCPDASFCFRTYLWHGRDRPNTHTPFTYLYNQPPPLHLSMLLPRETFTTQHFPAKMGKRRENRKWSYQHDRPKEGEIWENYGVGEGGGIHQFETTSKLIYPACIITCYHFPTFFVENAVHLLNERVPNRRTCSRGFYFDFSSAGEISTHFRTLHTASHSIGSFRWRAAFKIRPFPYISAKIIPAAADLKLKKASQKRGGDRWQRIFNPRLRDYFNPPSREKRTQSKFNSHPLEECSLQCK